MGVEEVAFTAAAYRYVFIRRRCERCLTRVDGSAVSQRREPSPPRSRARTPGSPSRRRVAGTPANTESRPSSPYKPERSRPVRSRSPGEIRLGNHSISAARTSAPPRRPSPPHSSSRFSSVRRSRSPPRHDTRRESSRGSRPPPSEYRGRERRRSYSPKSPQRRKTPPPTRKRTYSPSRSRSRSPTHTPPAKRHVLPPLKSPTRPPPPPPPTGPRIRLVPQQPPTIDMDGDTAMEEPSDQLVSVAELEVAKTHVVEASAQDLGLIPAPATVYKPASATTSVPTSSPIPPAASSPAIATPISPRPTSVSTPVLAMEHETKVPSPASVRPGRFEMHKDTEQRPPSHPRRRSRTPPTGPRHYALAQSRQNFGSTSHPHSSSNLPQRPDWGRRGAPHHQPTKAATPTEPAPQPEATATEPVGFVLDIPKFKAPKSITESFETEVSLCHLTAGHSED